MYIHKKNKCSLHSTATSVTPTQPSPKHAYGHSVSAGEESKSKESVSNTAGIHATGVGLATILEVKMISTYVSIFFSSCLLLVDYIKKVTKLLSAR